MPKKKKTPPEFALLTLENTGGRDVGKLRISLTDLGCSAGTAIPSVCTCSLRILLSWRTSNSFTAIILSAGVAEAESIELQEHAVEISFKARYRFFGQETYYVVLQLKFAKSFRAIPIQGRCNMHGLCSFVVSVPWCLNHSVQ
jgi:hypothetical protein